MPGLTRLLSPSNESPTPDSRGFKFRPLHAEAQSERRLRQALGGSKLAQQMHRTRRVSRLRAGTPVVEVVLGLHQGGAIPPGMTFEDLGVSAIVDLDDQAHWIPPTPLWGVYVYWPLPDGTKVHANTTRAIAHAVKNLVEAGHVVLIHCEAGLNRSCLVTARALIAMGWDPQTAISHVRACRRDARVLSNPAFVGWLQGERPGT